MNRYARTHKVEPGVALVHVKDNHPHYRHKEDEKRGRGAEGRELDGRPRNVRDTHRRVHTPPRRKGDARYEGQRTVQHQWRIRPRTAG